MSTKKDVFVIIGSASKNSSNQKLINHLANLTQDDFNLTVYHELKTLPHFDSEQSIENTPEIILAFREKIQKADGIIISTPEYIFSVPSGLKNAFEWCVSTTVFSGKPTGIITASAHGQKGHAELQLIVKTLMAKCTNETSLLIPGVKGKFSVNGEITDDQIKHELLKFADSFKSLLINS